jgi:predicted 3-demethylubiquinone-9 3-methyltransferase (glyoxalase superfamily)
MVKVAKKAVKKTGKSRRPVAKKKPGSPGPDAEAPKITTFLTFKEQGEEAVKLYVSLFKNSRIHSLVRWASDTPVAKGALQHAAFELDGHRFMAMDAGPYFSFGQGFSIFINCETQDEVDRLWKTLSEGGEEQMCGWVKDRWGISWQIVPAILGKLMSGKDPAIVRRVTDAMLKMKKLDIKVLLAAAEQ